MDRDSNQGGSNGSPVSAEGREECVAELDLASVSAIQQIRNIIFGKELQEFQSRFAKLEQLVERTAAELQAKIETNCRTLESYVKAELESVTKRVSTAEATGLQSSREVRESIEHATRELAAQLQSLKTESADDRHAIRENLLEQVRALQNEALELERRTTTAIEKAKADLETNKLDSARLAQMLNEVANRVSSGS